MVTTRGDGPAAIYNPVTGVLVTDPEERIVLQMFAREQSYARANRHETPAPLPEPVRPARGPQPRSSLLNLGKRFRRSAEAPDARVNAPAEPSDWPDPQRPDFAAQRDRAAKDERNRRDRAARLRRRQIREAQLGRRLPGPRGRGA